MNGNIVQPPIAKTKAEAGMAGELTGADVRPGPAITGGRVREARPRIEMWLKTNNLI